MRNLIRSKRFQEIFSAPLLEEQGWYLRSALASKNVSQKRLQKNDGKVENFIREVIHHTKWWMLWEELQMIILTKLIENN
jgi:hypothetical protein